MHKIACGFQLQYTDRTSQLAADSVSEPLPSPAMVVCSGGLVSFINRSATMSPFCGLPLRLPTSTSRRVLNGTSHRRKPCISSSSAPVDGPASTSYLNYSLRATQRQLLCVPLAASPLVLASPSSVARHYRNPTYAALSSRRLLYHLLQRSSH